MRVHNLIIVVVLCYDDISTRQYSALVCVDAFGQHVVLVW